jgi:hypothetical protein
VDQGAEQLPEPGLGESGPHHVMVVELDPVRGDLTGGGLPDIVQERGQPKDQVGLASLHDREGVSEHVLVLVDRVLLGGAWVGPDPAAIAENYRRILNTFRPAA